MQFFFQYQFGFVQDREGAVGVEFEFDRRDGHRLEELPFPLAAATEGDFVGERLRHAFGGFDFTGGFGDFTAFDLVGLEPFAFFFEGQDEFVPTRTRSRGFEFDFRAAGHEFSFVFLLRQRRRCQGTKHEHGDQRADHDLCSAHCVRNPPFRLRFAERPTATRFHPLAQPEALPPLPPGVLAIWRTIPLQGPFVARRPVRPDGARRRSLKGRLRRAGILLADLVPGRP